MKLTTAQHRVLAFLAKHGAASIDAYGSLVAADGDKTSAACAAAALRLVAKDLVTGRNGLVMLTEAGARNALPCWPKAAA